MCANVFECLKKFIKLSWEKKRVFLLAVSMKEAISINNLLILVYYFLQYHLVFTYNQNSSKSLLTLVSE